MKIDPTARVSPTAQLGNDVQIGPFATIGPKVTIGDGTIIDQGAIVEGKTTLGARNHLFAYSVVGSAPQDLKYHGEDTELIIGDENVVREFTTINCGTVTGDGVTRVGSRCFIMACSHIAHDCVLEDDVILANSVLLGGHCYVERGAKMMGNAAVNPFATIGSLAYVGGLTRIVQDVPPFTIVEGHPAKTRAINVVGCERAGVPKETIDALKEVFVKVFHGKELNRGKILDELTSAPNSDEAVMQFVSFIKRSLQGKYGRYRESLRKQ